MPVFSVDACTTSPAPMYRATWLMPPSRVKQQVARLHLVLCHSLPV